MARRFFEKEYSHEQIIPCCFKPNSPYTGNLLSLRRGFTLIELMIVVAIIGILAAIALGKFELLAHRSKRVEAVSALSAIYKGEMAYKAGKDFFLEEQDPPCLGGPTTSDCVLRQLGLEGLRQELKFYGHNCLTALDEQCVQIQGGGAGVCFTPPGSSEPLDCFRAVLLTDLVPEPGNAPPQVDWVYIRSANEEFFKNHRAGEVHVFLDDIRNTINF